MVLTDVVGLAGCVDSGTRGDFSDGLGNAECCGADGSSGSRDQHFGVGQTGDNGDYSAVDGNSNTAINTVRVDPVEVGGTAVR